MFQVNYIGLPNEPNARRLANDVIFETFDLVVFSTTLLNIAKRSEQKVHNAHAVNKMRLRRK